MIMRHRAKNIVVPAVATPVIALALDPSCFKLIMPNTSARIANIKDETDGIMMRKLIGSAMHIAIMPSTIEAVAILFILLCCKTSECVKCLFRDYVLHSASIFSCNVSRHAKLSEPV